MPQSFTILAVILLLIGVFLFISVGDLAAKVFKITTRTANSFSTLVSAIEGVEEGSQDPVAFFLDKDKYAVFGFAPNAERLELIVTFQSKESLVRYLTRPSPETQCKKDKSCVCLCSEISVDEKEFRCTGKMDCRSLENVIITDYTYVNELRQGLNTVTYSWKNGFGIIRSSDFPTLLQQIFRISSKDTLKALYVRKDFGRVGVCPQSKCEVIDPTKWGAAI